MKIILNFILFLFFIGNIFSQSINYPLGAIYRSDLDIQKKYLNNLYANGFWLDDIIKFSYENLRVRNIIKKNEIKKIITTKTSYVVMNNDTVNNKVVETIYLFDKAGNVEEIIAPQEHYILTYKDSLITSISYNDSMNITFDYNDNQLFSKIEVLNNKKTQIVRFTYIKEKIIKLEILDKDKIISERSVKYKNNQKFQNILIYENGKLLSDWKLFPNKELIESVSNTFEFYRFNTYELYSPETQVYEKKIYENNLLSERYIFFSNSLFHSKFFYKNGLIQEAVGDYKDFSYNEYYFEVISFKYFK